MSIDSQVPGTASEAGAGLMNSIDDHERQGCSSISSTSTCALRLTRSQRLGAAGWNGRDQWCDPALGLNRSPREKNISTAHRQIPDFLGVALIRPERLADHAQLPTGMARAGERWHPRIGLDPVAARDHRHRHRFVHDGCGTRRDNQCAAREVTAYR